MFETPEEVLRDLRAVADVGDQEHVCLADFPLQTQLPVVFEEVDFADALATVLGVEIGVGRQVGTDQRKEIAEIQVYKREREET